MWRRNFRVALNGLAQVHATLPRAWTPFMSASSQLGHLGPEIAAHVRGIEEAVADMLGVDGPGQRGPHDRQHAQSGADEWRPLSCWPPLVRCRWAVVTSGAVAWSALQMLRRPVLVSIEQTPVIMRAAERSLDSSGGLPGVKDIAWNSSLS